MGQGQQKPTISKNPILQRSQPTNKREQPKQLHKSESQLCDKCQH